MAKHWSRPAWGSTAIAAGLLLASGFLAVPGATQSVVQAGGYSDSLIVVPNAHDPQFRKYPDGRQQVVYTIDVEYPAKRVLRYVSAKLGNKGWKPLRHDFLNPQTPSSLVRGWQETENETQKPSVEVRSWDADWENTGHDVTEYDLEYRFRYPKAGSPDPKKLQVIALYIPAAAVSKMESKAARYRGTVQSAIRRIGLRCRVTVPKGYRKTPSNPPPNGESESVRYTLAYEAFWWNCVAVHAANLERRCPLIASGTPAASAGARDGASDAEFQIRRLLNKKYDALEVQKYLRSITNSPAAKEKMRPYFDKRTPERE
ncbi:MAG: hypothetical protein ACRD4V_13755 [Candidatus Acidiferrales bacterium]